MSADAEAALRRAEISLTEAAVLIDAGLWNGAMNRAYYAMFQAGRGILERAGLQAKTHRGLKGQLAGHALMEKEALQVLAQAQALREKADYELGFDTDEASAREVYANACDFVARARRHME